MQKFATRALRPSWMLAKSIKLIYTRASHHWRPDNNSNTERTLIKEVRKSLLVNTRIILKVAEKDIGV